MSLGTWFRDYVYIPMGGNRVKPLRFFLNIFTVWFLTGFWHGAEWNFIIWGIYFAILLLIEKYFLLDFLKKNVFISRIYTLFFVAVSFAIFSANNLAETGNIVCNLFGINKLPLVTDTFLYSLRNYWFVILIGIIASTPIPKILLSKLSLNKGFKVVWDIIEIPLMIILLVVVTGYLADGSFNPFLYFRF
jgi:alginate O-acetyltransferase complex protein AlgI